MNQSVGKAKEKRRAITAGLIGNVLEWYDFAIYGFFAPILAKLFFPSDDPTVSLIAAYGAFAAGFLMRPVGAIVFGHIGDRIGRKRALTLSIIMMAIPSLCIGLLPTYEQIGVAAGLLLVIMRMFQGIAVGGEYTGSIVFLAEAAPPNRRGFFSSWALFGANGGILLGSLVGTALSFYLTDAQLQGGGWRFPFLAGVLVAVIGLFIRRGVIEPEHSDSAAFPLVDAVRNHAPKLALIVGLNVGYAIVFYTAFIYMSGWLVTYDGFTHAQALGINSSSLILLAVLLPIVAMISDRVGRQPLMILGAGMMVVLPYPLAWMMSHPDPTYALLGQFGFAIVIAIYTAPLPAAMAELFPPEVRVSAVSVGYNIAFAIFGGTAPMVATWLIAEFDAKLSFTWYLSAMALVSLIAALSMHKIGNVRHMRD